MEEQRELDQQLLPNTVSESSDQDSEDSNAADEHVQLPLRERQASLELVLDQEEALNSLINLHALGKADARLDKKSVREVIHEVRSSSSSEIHSNTSPEPPEIAIRKRKSPDPPAMTRTPKRAAHSKLESYAAAKPLVPKPAPGQLNRPKKGLLTSFGVHGPRRHASSSDKFAMPEDPPQSHLLGTSDHPLEPGKVKRGRPVKAEATDELTTLTRPDGLERRKRGRPTKANARRYAELNPNKASEGRSTRQKQITAPTRHSARQKQVAAPTPSSDGAEKSASRKSSTAIPDSPRSHEQRKEEQRPVDPRSSPASSPQIVRESIEVSQAEEDNGALIRGEGVDEAQEAINESRDPSAEVVSGDRNDATYAATVEPSVDSNEEEQSSDDEDIAADSDDEMLEEDVKLFGGERPWSQILEGAREVGMSKVKDIETRKRPKIATTTVRELLTLVNESRSLYKELGSGTGTAAQNKACEQQLSNLQAGIDDMLGELSEPRASDQGSLLLQDIYAHAIPAMVYLLRAALLCRTKDYSQPDSVECLEEVIHIQVKVIQLCETARRWKVEPATKRPIKGAVAKKILPYMRDLKERCFSQELHRRRTLASRSTFQERFAESHKRMRERIESEKAKRKQERQDNLNSFCRPLGARPKATGNQLQQSVHTTKPHPRSQPVTDKWTNEQNLDLVNQLMRKETRNLPSEERYLAILNTPSLQNKLPEHIRNRALFYKEDMIARLGPLSYVMSIE